MNDAVMKKLYKSRGLSVTIIVTGIIFDKLNGLILNNFCFSPAQRFHTLVANKILRTRNYHPSLKTFQVKTAKSNRKRPSVVERNLQIKAQNQLKDLLVESKKIQMFL